MHFKIITIYPDQISNFISYSNLGKAQTKGLIKVDIYNLRDWSTDNYKTIDDKPYGGGPGMVMKIEPIFKALQDIKTEKSFVLLPTPFGKVIKQADISRYYSIGDDRDIIIIAPHFEGVDYRVHQYLIDEEFSIGEYILSGGEVPAIILMDAITRLIPGVLGNPLSLNSETYSDDMTDYPVYTRPEEYMGMKVPEVLLNGNHAEIEKFRNSSRKIINQK